MDFTVSQRTFCRALESMGKLIPSSAMQLVSISLEGANVILRTSIYEAGVQIRIAAVSTLHTGRAFLLFTPLLQLVRTFSGGELHFTIDTNHCVMETKNVYSKMPCQKPDIELASYNSQTHGMVRAFSMDAEDIHSAIDDVAFCAADVQTHYQYFRCICVTGVASNEIHFIASDGSRLAHRIFTYSYHFDQKLLFPALQLRPFALLLKKGMVRCYLCTHTRIAVLVYGDVEYFIRLQVATYPQVQNVYPSQYTLAAVVETPALLQDVQRASVVSDGVIYSIDLDFSDQEIVLTGRGEHGEEVVSHEPAVINGTPVNLRVDYQHFLDTLRAAKSPKITLKTNPSGLHRALVCIPSNRNVRYSIMPLMTKEA